MAKPITLAFSKFKIWVEDPDHPGQFVAPCGFTQKALNLQAETSDTNVPDCDDPEAPAWKERAISALSGQVTGSGVMAMGVYAFYRRWFLGAKSRRIRVEFDDVRANGGGYYEGYAILSNLGHSVQLQSDGNKTQQQMTLDNDGEWAWVDAAA